MNRFHSILIVLALWAAIFLPGLGSTELKGEEGRRILPAVTMLETGNWLVPYVGGKPFLRKPPLANWAIAEIFKWTGVRNEWMARLPSALSILALAVSIVACGGKPAWMNVETALIAAIFALTQLATVDKGRHAEIEAPYFALTGIAILLWLAWWIQRRPAWLVWTVPFVFLGLALLAKGPLPNLLFFYAIVGCVLWESRDWAAFRHPAHLVGVALMVGIFALWLLPYRENPATIHAEDVWKHQLATKVAGRFDLAGWLTNIPRGLGNHLPWVLLVPLLWRRDLDELGSRRAAAFRGTRLAVTACFFGLLLIPSILPRYTLPLLVPFALLLAIAVADPALAPHKVALRAWWRANHFAAIAVIAAACAGPVAVAIVERQAFLEVRSESMLGFGGLLVWPLLGSGGAIALALAVLAGRSKMARPSLVAASSAAVFAAAMFVFGSTGIRFVNRSNTLRPMANAINRTVPAGQILTICDPEYQPAVFYLEIPYAYAADKSEVPPNAQWLLVPASKGGSPEENWPGFEVVREFSPGRLQKTFLLRHRI